MEKGEELGECVVVAFSAKLKVGHLLPGAERGFQKKTLPSAMPHPAPNRSAKRGGRRKERSDNTNQSRTTSRLLLPFPSNNKKIRTETDRPRHLISCDSGCDRLPVTPVCLSHFPFLPSPRGPATTTMSSLPAPSASSPSSSALAPTTRSRTLLFISYRDSSARAPRRSRGGRQYDDAYYGHQPSDENEGLMDHQAVPPHTSLDVELPPKWFVRSERALCIPEHIPFVFRFH